MSASAAMAPRWSQVRRLLVVRMDNIGDVILLGPALRALRRELPAAHITLLASPAGSRAVPLLPWVDEVLVQRGLWQDASGALPFDPRREIALVQRLQEGAFDTAMIFTSFSQTAFPPAYACYLAGIETRVGHAALFGGAVLSHQVPPPPIELHQAERNLHLLEAAGLDVGRRDLAVCIPPEAETEADGLLRELGIDHGDRFVAVAPGASATARRYPRARFAEAAGLLGTGGAPPAVVVGNEHDATSMDGILTSVPGVRSLLGKTSVPVLAAVLHRAAVVLANNSLVLHLSDALRRPVVGTYSGTDLETQWQPRNAPHVLLRRHTDCSPCYAFTCPFDLECLDIDPREVARAALELMAVAGRGERSRVCAS